MLDTISWELKSKEQIKRDGLFSKAEILIIETKKLLTDNVEWEMEKSLPSNVEE